jgi:hypothetical protein
LPRLRRPWSSALLQIRCSSYLSKPHLFVTRSPQHRASAVGLRSLNDRTTWPGSQITCSRHDSVYIRRALNCSGPGSPAVPYGRSRLGGRTRGNRVRAGGEAEPDRTDLSWPSGSRWAAMLPDLFLRRVSPQTSFTSRCVEPATGRPRRNPCRSSLRARGRST